MSRAAITRGKEIELHGRKKKWIKKWSSFSGKKEEIREHKRRPNKKMLTTNFRDDECGSGARVNFLFVNFARKKMVALFLSYPCGLKLSIFGHLFHSNSRNCNANLVTKNIIAMYKLLKKPHTLAGFEPTIRFRWLRRRPLHHSARATCPKFNYITS
jgi:hypothetical protein